MLLKPYVPEGFAETVFKQRYAFTPEETWDGMSLRCATQMALAEAPDKQPKYKQVFYDIINYNLFVPGGRVLYNSGKNDPSLLNCFVLSNQLDSKEGWGNLSYEMIVTSMCGGGCGIDFSDVRPNNAPIGINKGVCPGPLGLMELIDAAADPVRNGGGRRVALMFSLDITHPDIMAFLDAKLTRGKLTHANVSVRINDCKAFVKAVKNNEDIELSWKGKFKSKINAKELWDKIVINAYNSAEPGALNLDLANAESNIYYIMPLVTTNPCGEIVMPPYDSCCLGHLVLPRFIDPETNEIDMHLLANTIRSAVRFLDNVLSVNHYPLEEMQHISETLRRIGLGVTGLADMLTMLGYRYGSEEANKFTDKLFRFISKIAYESSVMLAVEKGAFPLCNPAKHIESGYMKRMTNKIRALVAEHGIRNCAILTIAPTGTTSIVSGNWSSGIEPPFSPAYERRWWVGSERHTETVYHPLFAQYLKEGKDVSNFVGSHDLSVREHLEVQKVIQKHIDNAVSKTINIPEDYPVEGLSDLWLEYLPHLKGTTYYRESTRGYVDPQTGEVKEPPLKRISTEEALEQFKFDQEMLVGSEESKCKSGVCEL